MHYGDFTPSAGSSSKDNGSSSIHFSNDLYQAAAADSAALLAALHAGMQDIIHEACQAAGCFSKIEMLVPARSCKVQSQQRGDGGATPPRWVEAWLDVVAHNGLGDNYYVDALVRNPFAPLYMVSGGSWICLCCNR